MLVRPELLAQLNLREGDDLLDRRRRRFQIRGVIQSEPGRNLGAFSLGSRVFIDFADLPSTGLLSFGSRASYQLLLQVPSPPPLPGRRDPSLVLAGELSKAFVNDFIGVRSYRQNEGRMNQNLSRAENYLSLVGLVVLILGGIGVSSVTRVFVQQKVRSIAILKCVGSTTRSGARHLPDTGRAAGPGWKRARRRHRGRRAAVAAGVRRQSRRLAAGRLRADVGRRAAGVWRSACSCRSCFQSSRCSKCGT